MARELPAGETFAASRVQVHDAPETALRAAREPSRVQTVIEIVHVKHAAMFTLHICGCPAFLGGRNIANCSGRRA